MIWLALGCVAHVHGVLENNGQAELHQPEGRALRLVLGPDHDHLAYLRDCTVQVEGPRVGRRVWVRDYSVLAAADGSAPFVGRLRAHGAQLLIEDHNSGSVFVLSGDNAAKLAPFEGQMVLIIGFVSAPHVVQVMGWQVLADTEG